MTDELHPTKGAKAFVVKITMDLVIIAHDQKEITSELIFDVAERQYACVGPTLMSEFIQTKRIMSKEEIPAGWRHVLPWNDDDADLFPASYIPSPLELLAEQAE